MSRVKDPRDRIIRSFLALKPDEQSGVLRELKAAQFATAIATGATDAPRARRQKKTAAEPVELREPKSA